MKSRDRLVVCPECDELIVEDEWHLHKQECRDDMLCERTDDEIINYIAHQQTRDVHWYEKHDRIRQLAEQAVARWESSTAYSGPAMFPGPIVPVERFDAGFLRNGGLSPTTPIDFKTNTTTHAIIVKIPRVPLKREEALAVAIEQLYEQWEVYTDV